MKHLGLELRRVRGALAYGWVIAATPYCWQWMWWPLLPWAGLYAFYDSARPWRDEA